MEKQGQFWRFFVESFFFKKQTGFTPKDQQIEEEYLEPST